MALPNRLCPPGHLVVVPRWTPEQLAVTGRLGDLPGQVAPTADLGRPRFGRDPDRGLVRGDLCDDGGVGDFCYPDWNSVDWNMGAICPT